MYNPFNISFGKEPSVCVSRLSRTDTIIESFTSDEPPTQVYMITGVRGYGKTVTMNIVARTLEEDKGWIVLRLNPERDLLEAMAANLYEHAACKPAFIDAGIDFHLFNVSVSLNNSHRFEDVEVVLRRMLQTIKGLDKRVLITIDEVTNSANIKAFAGAFQIMLAQDLPVYLLMTGLFENIRRLQNEQSLTFLYRAPRIDLKPLGVKAMANDYARTLKISDDKAVQMARFTKGYPYAFQVLGYLLWQENRSLHEVIPEFEEIMEEYAYEKIWSELSDKDRNVIEALAVNGRMRIKDIQQATGTTSASFSTYRKRLSERGLIDVSDYGYAELTLPRFGEVVCSWMGYSGNDPTEDELDAVRLLKDLVAAGLSGEKLIIEFSDSWMASDDFIKRAVAYYGKVKPADKAE